MCGQGVHERLHRAVPHLWPLVAGAAHQLRPLRAPEDVHVASRRRPQRLWRRHGVHLRKRVPREARARYVYGLIRLGHQFKLLEDALLVQR